MKTTRTNATASMTDGRTITVEATTAGEVYDAIGAECGWWEGDGEIERDTPLASLTGRDYGRWLAWPTRDAMDGPDGNGDDGSAALAEITIA